MFEGFVEDFNERTRLGVDFMPVSCGFGAGVCRFHVGHDDVRLFSCWFGRFHDDLALFLYWFHACFMLVWCWFMGKLRKDVIDEIRRLGGEGYTITEIADMVDASRDAVRKYLVDGDSSVVLDGAEGVGLSDGVTRRLYDLQGVLSASSIADAVERAYRDEVAVMKFKLNLWEVYALHGEEFTVEGLIDKLVEYIEEVEYELKIYTDGYPEDQKTIAELKEADQVKYDEGYQTGYGKAKQDHAIFVNCVYCGNPYQVQPMSKAHRFISEILSANEWGHISCENQAQHESERGTRALRDELMR